MKKRKKRKYLYDLLIVLLLCVGIGYAILMQDLNITGYSHINNATWNIYWDNVQVTTGSLSAETPQINPTTKTSVSYEITLHQPGDFYEFTIDAVNDGSIPATITAVTSKMNNTPISSLPVYLNYQVTMENGDPVIVNHVLADGDSETYKVRIEYRTDINPEDLPNSSQTFSFDFIITYEQGDPGDILYAYHFPLSPVHIGDDISNLSNVYYSWDAYYNNTYSSTVSMRYLVNSHNKIVDMCILYRDRDKCFRLKKENDYNKIINNIMNSLAQTCDTTVNGVVSCPIVFSGKTTVNLYNPRNGAYENEYNVLVSCESADPYHCRCKSNPYSCVCDNNPYEATSSQEYDYAYSFSSFTPSNLNQLNGNYEYDPAAFYSRYGKKVFMQHTLSHDNNFVVQDTNLVYYSNNTVYPIDLSKGYSVLYTEYFTNFPSNCTNINSYTFECTIPGENITLRIADPDRLDYDAGEAFLILTSASNTCIYQTRDNIFFCN